MNRRWKQIISLFMAVCIVITMLPMKAFAELDTGVPAQTLEIGTPEDELSLSGTQAVTSTTGSAIAVTTGSAITMPIPGDVLQLEGGELKDGVLVFDLGDYDTFKTALAKGERFPITITRPKGGEAGYPVTAKVDSYSGSNNIGFQKFNAEKGGDSLEYIEFLPNVTSKTIYIGEEYSFGDNSRSRGTLSSYICFNNFDRTSMTTPVIRLETTKNDIEGDKADLPLVVHAKILGIYSGQVGSSRVVEISFKDRKNSFSYTDRGFCEITNDLTLNLKNGAETHELKPVEAVGSILSHATFVIPPYAPISEEWEVVSISGIKNAADSSVKTLTYSDDYNDTEIDFSAYAFSYDGEPVFGPITTDKEVYKGLESVKVSVPIQNAEDIDFETNFDDWWSQVICLSYDGGQSFIPQNSISWNSDTRSIEATFAAPENNNSSAFPIAVELYRSYGEETHYRALFGAFKIIEISAETAEFVPIESIIVTGIPTSKIENNTEYPLNVKILPENATFSGYAWETGNPDRANVTGDKLVFYEEGKVTITLRSEEAAYRTEQGLPANDNVLLRTFTFFAGAPRLITGSILVEKSDTTTAVTARFNDNFNSYEEEWKVSNLTYEIRNAEGKPIKSGEVMRKDGVTEVSLAFDDVTPKTASLYENGEFKPAYTITLTATATGTASVSATANVYITPPPVIMECITKSSNALVGEAATFTFEIRNLLPGYSSRYEINGGDTPQSGPLIGGETTDPATGLITLTGSVVLTPNVQGKVSEFRTITVYANNKDEKPQAISKRINVVDQSASRMIVKFCDGLDGTEINPEKGDKPDEFYGIRESKIAELTKDSTYNSQAIFEYLNRMMRTKTLIVAVPEEWGQMQAQGASNTETGSKDISLYLSREDIGKKVRLSWENVSTTKEFTFKEDDLSGKVYAFCLTNAADGQLISISYKNGNGQSVKKKVTPYKGYVILYEPNGIKGDIWMSQEISTGSYRFALVTSPRSLSKTIIWAWDYSQASMVVSSLANNHRYTTSDSTQIFTANTVVMSEPVASFSPTGDILPTIVRYCAIDGEGKVVADTKGKLSPASGSGHFQLPFRALYENQGSQLMVEFEYAVTAGKRTQLEYYDVQTLEENLRYGKVNSYTMAISGYLQRLTATDADGQTRNLPISSRIVAKLLPEDTLEVQLATGTRVIKNGSLNIVNYQPVSDVSGNVSHWEPDFTVVAPAVSIDQTDWSGFTPNKYTTLRFKPTTGQMTPGLVAQMSLNIVFTDGSSDKLAIGWGQMADNGTTEYVKKITDILKAQKFIHEEQRLMCVGEAKVEENTRNVTVEGVKVSFSKDVAAIFDKIKVDFALPSDNPSNPFTFEVIRRGDEYDIRGYVNGSIMNKAGWVNLTDRWYNASFSDVFDTTKEEVNTAFSVFSSMGSFPGAKGYLEGKAVVTPSGDIRITFNEGRIVVQSQLLYKPTDLFDLGYYCEWGIAFEGMVRTKMEIKAPDNGGDPASPLNFNLVEVSNVDINVLTGSNAVSFDVGVYALDIGLHGAIQASYNQKSIYRPYAKDAQKMQRGVSFNTSGDLMASNYNRIKTDILDFSEVTERVWSIWNSRIIYYGQKLYGACYFIEPDDQSNPLHWDYKPNISLMSALPMSAAVASFGLDASNLGASGADSLPRKLSTDTFATTQYYNKSTGMVYRDSSSNIIASGIDGSRIETVTGSAFGLDIASAGSGSTVAAWGSYRDDLNTEDLDTLDEDGMLKYTAGMTEIKASVFDGINWSSPAVLTNNEMVDVKPKTSTNGNNGVVVWTQGVLDSYSIDNGLPVIEFLESRLMFAQYKGSTWGTPAQLYVPSGERIADYSVAMADDGSALATLVMDSGKIVIIKILSDQSVSVINNSLPVAVKTSLIYNGETYTLACYDANSMALTLYELSIDGFVMNTEFSGIPVGIGKDFRLFVDWSAVGTKASVLVWLGTSEDNESEANIYASRMWAMEGDNDILISSPITAATIENPYIPGENTEAGVFVSSYDAYINGNDLKILTLFRDVNSNRQGGAVYLDEAEARFENTIETTPCVNNIFGLMPGFSTDFNIKVKNNGFASIKSIETKVGDGQIEKTDVKVIPNDEVTVKAIFVPMRELKDRTEYTVTAVFEDGSSVTVTGFISLRQTDIAAEVLSFTLEKGKYNTKALITNKTPFSLSGKTVVVGVYEDSFGTIPVVEEKIDGTEFENGKLGTSVLVDLTFIGRRDLPQPLYFIAKAYDSSNEEIPDKDSLNNILPITSSVLVSAIGPDPNPGDNGGGSSSGGSSSGSTTTTTTRRKTPNQPVAVMVPVTATVGANGVARASISNKAIKDAIIKAKVDAKTQSKIADGIAIELNIDMPIGTDSLSITLSSDALSSLVSAGVTSLSINDSLISIRLDEKALVEIQKQSSGNITISIVPRTDLSEKAKAIIGTRPVYNITISYKKDEKMIFISDFGDGSVTISIHYVLGVGEEGSGLYTVYIDKEGNVIEIANSAYDANSGRVIFTTPHFSIYGIGYRAPSNKYKDIASHWAKGSIDYILGRGLITGVAKKQFSPDSDITRGALVTALGRLAEVDTKKYHTSSFTDVKAGIIYSPYIEWACENDILQGISKDKFAPSKSITREEIALVIENFAKATNNILPITREEIKYADNAKIGEPYKDAVRAVQQAGIMMGFSDSKFDPKANTTRAEVSVMLHRYVKLTIDPATTQSWALNDDGGYMYYKEGKVFTGKHTIDKEKYIFNTDGILMPESKTETDIDAEKTKDGDKVK